jgi:hypothetical protein
VKPGLSGLGSQELGRLSFSQEIATTEVKGWITKNSVPKGETHKRTEASSTIPPDSPLGIILKFFFF